MVVGQLRGYLILLTVFVLGAVVGGAGVFTVLEHRSTARLVHDVVDERRLELLTGQLVLDQPQRARVAGILNEANHEARTIARETDAKCGHPLLDHRAKVDDRIRAELRPDQQAKFDELLAKRRERETTSGKPLSP